MGEMTLVKPKRFIDLAATDLMIRHCYKQFDGTERVVYEIGAVRQMASYLRWLERSIKRVATAKHGPLVHDKLGWHLTPEAKELWHVLRNADQAPQALCEGRKLSPWIKIGLHLAYKWEPRLRRFAGPSGVVDVNPTYPRRVMAHIVKFIRRVCTSKAFTAWVNNDSRNAKENYRSCCRYLLRVFAGHARLLVLRIDLYFEGDAKSISDSEEARKAYNKFLRHLSGNHIVPDVLAYIGKTEDGLERRTHHHILCVLDGDKHQQAHNLTERLGRFWVEECVGTPALASYKNCYERKNDYAFNCLGLLHYTDDRMLMGLREALEYMCKEGAHTLVKSDNTRNLRKGLAPKVKGRRRGAPRKRGNDLSLAELILFTEGRR